MWMAWDLGGRGLQGGATRSMVALEEHLTPAFTLIMSAHSCHCCCCCECLRCSFDDVQHWQRTPTSLARNLAAVNTQLQQHLVAAALTNAIYEQLQQDWQQLHNSSGQQQQWQQQDADAAQCIGNGGSNSSSTRWLPPKPQHIPLLKRATEPSMEERFSKAGISLEVLNQPGGARLKGDDG